MKSINFDRSTKVAFIFTGVLIGLLLTVQIRSAVPPSSFIADEINVQTVLIKSYLNDQAVLKSRIVSLREKIEENQQKTKTTSRENNLEVLRELKADIGLEVVKGRGAIITLDDGFFGDRENADSIAQSLIHASDLRDLVNLLRTTNTEAIAINDQRIIASTPITSVGNTILVNNFNLLPPFSIVAIGDPALIMQRFDDPKSVPDLKKRIEDKNVYFNVESQAHLVAPIYNGNFNLKYIIEAAL